MQHHITLRGVMYTREIIHNKMSILQAWKNLFMVRVDDDPRNAKWERMDLHHKPLENILMCGFKTREGLYKAVSHVSSNQTLITGIKK